MTMKPIQVLLVEDNPGDARLFREFLHEDDPAQVEVDHVDRLKTGLEHLALGKPDVILLDLGLPDSQGMDTFTRVYAQAPDVPIVVLTGLNDAEQAVKAVKAGAQDYLVKGEISGGLLVRAIRYAIERKRSEKALLESFAFNTMLLQTMPLRMDIVDESGQILFLNPVMENALEQDALGARCWDLYKDDKKQCADCPLKQNIEVGVTKTLETSRVLGGRTFEITHSGILYKGKKAILEVFHDITERKQAEVEIRRYNEQLAAAGDIGAILAASLDLQQIYQQLGQAVNRLIPDIATIFISRFDPKQQLISATYGMQDEEQINVTELPAIPLSPSGQGTQSEVIRTGKPLIVPDLQNKLSGRPLVRVGSDGPDTQSAVYVPLLSKNEVMGVIQLQSYTPARFTENDVKLLSLVGNTAAIAIQNARLFETTQNELALRKQAEDEIRRRLSELEVLYASSMAIGQSLQPQEIGQKIVEILSESLHWHHITLRQYHPESETLELLAFQRLEPENEAESLAVEERFRAMIHQPGQGLSGWVIQHGQSVYCKDVTKDPRYLEVEPGICSGMYVPLKIAERTIGCLSVESEKLDAFTETDEWLITTLAAQAAGALENARLFAETSRRLEQVQALHNIDMAISSVADLHIILDIFLEQTVRQLGVDAVDILLLNPNTQQLDYTAGYGFRTTALRHTHLRLGESFAGRAALDRHTIHIPDLGADLEGLARSLHLADEGFITYYAVPLIAKGQVKGVLEIFHREALKTDAEWLGFMETLAGQAAIAIENITLFDGLQLSKVELMQAYDATIEGWSHALDLRDKETEGHTLRVTEMTLRLARGMGIPEADITHIRRGALLHDIGKMGVPDSILLKPGSLSDEEWAIMRRHPQYAFDLLSPIHYLRPALDIPYSHHEKWDGTGYPRGLKGEAIPLAARLFAVIDVWDALTSDRPYRKAWTHEKSINHITEQSGSHFDPKVVELFLGITWEEVQTRL